MKFAPAAIFKGVAIDVAQAASLRRHTLWLQAAVEEFLKYSSVFSEDAF